MVTRSSCSLQPREHVDVTYVGEICCFMFSNLKGLWGCEVSKKCPTTPLIIAQKKLFPTYDTCTYSDIRRRTTL